MDLSKKQTVLLIDLFHSQFLTNQYCYPCDFYRRRYEQECEPSPDGQDQHADGKDDGPKSVTPDG